MSGECENCREHTLECCCNKTFPLNNDHMNSFPEELPVNWINVNGREEHEAILRDSAKCEELGLDQMYEIMVYLKRWGGWLKKKVE